jgi:hypothetical protein
VWTTSAEYLVENFLSDLGSGGIWLNWLPGFGLFDLPPRTLSVAAIFAGICAVILCKFTGKLGALTLPLNYIALLVGALAANRVLDGISVPLAGELQAPIVYALSGMCIAGVMMMALLRRL